MCAEKYATLISSIFPKMCFRYLESTRYTVPNFTAKFCKPAT